MKVKERIFLTLQEAFSGLEQLSDHFTVITAAGMILSDVPILHTDDIDLLVSERDEELLQYIWKERMLKDFCTQNDHLFRSNIHRYHFDEMDIEVIAGLEVCKMGEWIPVEVNECISVNVADQVVIDVPSIREQKRLLKLFGREKDLNRLKLLDEMFVHP